ncbi:MAG: transporter substrate-binding protein [Proteobacteria bacterium]|nr:transporter substrate-binding protein [Pseudomonadota bacterium]
MQRRVFIRNASLGLAAATGAAAVPTLTWAEDLPTIKWRMASSVPKTLDTIYGVAEVMVKRIADLTEGKFEIRVFAGGEIVPPTGVLDAVQQNTVECGQTCGYYYHGKNKAFSLDTAIPFGLNARQMNAWCYFGDGLAILREFFAKYNVVNFPGGNSGTQMGGWFRKEIKSLDDLKGLKIRIPGFGAEVFLALGAVPQALPSAEIYPALERGAIDAAEWVGPYDDEKLGLYKVAKFYYYPSWWEPGPMFNLRMLAGYDARNPPAIQRLAQNGVQLKRYPDDAMKAAYEAAQKIYAEESARNPDFKKIYDSQRAFQQVSDIWMGLAENTLASFMQSQLRKK